MARIFERFVTVVSVEEEDEEGGTKGSEDCPPPKPPPRPAPRQFVTVVSVEGTSEVRNSGASSTVVSSDTRLRWEVPSPGKRIPERVVVFRLPGERLGLGLRFDGGGGVGVGVVEERVRRLFIHSVAPDSPAARASGGLEPGDQILEIEGRPVTAMTRVECVSRLKEASVRLTLVIVRGAEEDDVAPPLPPRAPPPRKTFSRLMREEVEETPDWLPPPPRGFDDGDYDCEPRRKRPPPPAVYLDLLSAEDAAAAAAATQSESDETNSSASTVVDRLSISSSGTAPPSRNSSFNRFDLAQALSPFEQLEEELIAERRRRRRSLSSPAGEGSKQECPSLDLDGDAESPARTSGEQTGKKSLSFRLKSRPFSWHPGKHCHDKEDIPPTPPPRSSAPPLPVRPRHESPPPEYIDISAECDREEEEEGRFSKCEGEYVERSPLTEGELPPSIPEEESFLDSFLRETETRMKSISTGFPPGVEENQERSPVQEAPEENIQEASEEVLVEEVVREHPQDTNASFDDLGSGKMPPEMNGGTHDRRSVEEKVISGPPKTFSTAWSWKRPREDLGESLRTELGVEVIGEVEEEEIVESSVECETQEEVRLVLQALHERQQNQKEAAWNSTPLNENSSNKPEAEDKLLHLSEVLNPSLRSEGDETTRRILVSTVAAALENERLASESSKVSEVEKEGLSLLSEEDVLEEKNPSRKGECGVSWIDSATEEGGRGKSVSEDRRRRFVSPSASPPTYSRPPPDGREFPANYTDESPLSAPLQYSLRQEIVEKTSSSSSSFYSSGKVSSSEFGGRWRRQDERSEKSVRDKIAMFSNGEEEEEDEDRLRRMRQQRRRPEGLQLKRAFTEDDVRGEEEEAPRDHNSRAPPPSSKASLSSPTSVMSYGSMINVRSTEGETKENVRPPGEDTRRVQEENKSGSGLLMGNRSQSLMDVGGGRPTTAVSTLPSPQTLTRLSRGGLGGSSKTKRHSVGAYDRPSAYKYGVEKPEDRERRTSLNNLIEQRRKSASKLRGLVIPSGGKGGSSPTAAAATSCPRLPPLDLPRISSSSSSSGLRPFTPRQDDLEEDSRKHFNNNNTTTSRTKGLTTSRKRFDNSSSLPPFSWRSPSSSPSGGGTPTMEEAVSGGPFSKNYSPRIRGELDDSDDSTLSSASNKSRRRRRSLSPMMPDGDSETAYRRRLQHSIPVEDEHNNKRGLGGGMVLKNGSVEAENRRNVIKSAKCSSGRSSDEQSTPEVTRKYTPRVSPPRQFEAEATASSTSSSRRDSVDSVIPASSGGGKGGGVVSAQAVYFDREGAMYEEPRVKVAYLNEVVDGEEEVLEEEENGVNRVVISEIPLRNRSASPVETQREKSRWSALEERYASLAEEEEKTTSKRYHHHHHHSASKKKDFKALAEEWRRREEEDSSPCHTLQREEDIPVSPSSPPFIEEERRPTTLDLPRINVLPDRRKFSVPEYATSGLKLREKKDGPGMGGIPPSRPTSLIEGSAAVAIMEDPLQQDRSSYLTAGMNSNKGPSSSSNDHLDLLDSSSSSSVSSHTGSKEVLDAFAKRASPAASVPQEPTGGHHSSASTPKMSEILRAFERHDIMLAAAKGSSSLDSAASDDGCVVPSHHYGSASSLASGGGGGQRDQFGSITSLSSSTSIISPQELAQLIEEANHSLEESGTPSHEILVVVLHRETMGGGSGAGVMMMGGSIGITLAGGADYETKEVTVHKVIPGSLADRDGRIQKGDRILSINGKTLRGVSHREALNILKSPRPEVVLVLSRSRSVTPQESTVTYSNGGGGDAVEGGGVFGLSHRSVFINHVVPPPRPPKILESPMDSKSLLSDCPGGDSVPRGPPTTITLVKDGAGLGFSLEGGKDSPLGDRPLTVKKIFTGGAADKGGVLKVGDELLGVNSVDLTNMARIEAWNFLKKLPDGKVNLLVRQKLDAEETEADK